MLAPHLVRFRVSLGAAARGLTDDELAQLYLTVRMAAKRLTRFVRLARRTSAADGRAQLEARLGALARLDALDQELAAHRRRSRKPAAPRKRKAVA